MREFSRKLLVIVMINLLLFSSSAQATSAISGLSNLTVWVNTTTLIDHDVSFSGGALYSNGYIEYSLASPTTNDNFNLQSDSNPTAQGAISVVGTTVYLGDGSGRKKIGTIDATKNGQHGQPLRINFVAPQVRNIANGDFETGNLSGWSVSNRQLPNNTSLNGFKIAIGSVDDGNGSATTRKADQNGDGFGVIHVGVGNSMTWSSSNQTATKHKGRYALRLFNSGNIIFTNFDPGTSDTLFGSIHGPTIKSHTFHANASDNISFYWSAQNGGDWYEVLGYLNDITHNTRQLLFSQRGSSQPWANKALTISETADYQFEFVAGTYDASGGKGVGGSLYIDDVTILSSDANDSVLTTIARNVSYQNTYNSGPTPRTLTLSAKTVDGTIISTTSVLNFFVAPVASPDVYSVFEDGSLIIPSSGILINDHDANHDPLTAVLDTDASHGLLSLSANGGFSYIPLPGYSGSDTFRYYANDATYDSNIVTVTLTVKHVNHPPIANYDSYTTPEDTPLTITVSKGVLHNDTDQDVHDTLHAIKLTDPVSGGSVALASDGSLTYSPPLNYNGIDTFTYKANDGHSDSNPVTVFITVSAVNDKPVATDDSYSTPEDTVLNNISISVLKNDQDSDANHLSATKVSDPANGIVTFQSDGFFTYTPDPNFNGVDSFTYTAGDGQLDSNVATVSISVTAVNDVPVATSDSYSVHEDTGLGIDAAHGLLHNDSDPELNQLTVSLVSDVSNGTLHLSKDGSFYYTPATNYNGADSFSYKVNDGQLDSNTVTVTLTIDAVNDAPVTVNDHYATPEDTVIKVIAKKGILANDSDLDGDTLQASKLTQASHGVVHFKLDGSFSYTPDPNFNGADSFTYKVSDGVLEGNEATVSIDVHAVNDVPVAQADVYNTPEDTPLKVDAGHGVLNNDTDFEGDSLVGIQTSSPAHGQVHFHPSDGSFKYTPNGNFNGKDSFTYQATDGHSKSNEVTITIKVHTVNDAPVAVDDSYSVGEDGFLRVPLNKGILANDHDADADILHIDLSTHDQVTNGALQIELNGEFTYKPDPGFFGTDTFSYIANDGALDSNEVTVTITVHHVNHPTLPNVDAYTIAEDSTLVVPTAKGLLANDLDLDGDTLLVTNIPTTVNHGHLQTTLDGSFTYTPTPGYNGLDSFTYIVNDGSVDSAPVMVNLTVTHTNHEPLAAGDVYSIPQGGVLSISAPGLLANDLDIDGDSFFVLPQSFPVHGTLHQNLDGSFTYQPAAGFEGTDSYTYMANDGQLNSKIVTVTLNVHHTNDAPLAGDDSYSTPQDSVLSIPAPGLLANDLDSDGDSLFVLIQSFPSHGALHQDLDGGFTYQPAAGFQGLDSYTYMANDGKLNSGLATVIINVNHINHAPLAGDDSYSTPQDSVLSIPAPGLLANDLDSDGDSLFVLIQSFPSHGALHQDLDGGFTYQPAAGFQGLDSYTYMASDGKLNSGVVTVTINVNHTNHAPLAGDDSYSTARNTVLQVNPTQGVLNNDVDIDGDLLTAIVVSQPQHGTLHALPDGSFTYTPALDYAGLDDFTYKATDSALASSTVTVTIQVNFTNRPPVAANDNYNLPQDAVLTVPPSGLLTNDTDADGDNLFVLIQSQPVHGALHQDLDGGFVYTPAAGYQGTDSYTYMASDGKENSNVVTVSININHNNHEPLAAADSYSIARNTTLQVNTAQGVLNNDVDIDGDLLTANIVSQPQHGTLHALTDGSFTYTPALDYAGLDNFTYKATDGALESNTVTVTIQVNSTNLPPVAVDDNYSVDQDTTLQISAVNGLLSNDSDPDGDQLSAVIVTQPQHGTLHAELDGRLTYRPDTAYTGSDSFTYKANDGAADSNTATVEIEVLVVAIPTLNEWGMIILTIVLTLIGVAVVRRREKDPYISL